MTYLSNDECAAFIQKIPPLSDEIKEDVRLNMPAYLFKEKAAGDRVCSQLFCTRCRNTISLNESKFIFNKNELKHNSTVLCPYCNEEATVKDSGRSRMYLTDLDYIGVFFLINSGELVLVTYEVTKSYYYYRDDYIHFIPHYALFFTHNGTFVFENRFIGKEKQWRQMSARPKLLRFKGVGDMYYSYWGHTQPIFATFYNVDAVEQCELYKYSCFNYYFFERENANYKIIHDFLDVYLKHPVLVERLIKEGYSDNLQQYLELEPRAAHHFNIRAKTTLGFLKLKNKGELKAVKKAAIKKGKHSILTTLRNAHALREIGVEITFDNLIAEGTLNYSASRTKLIAKIMDVEPAKLWYYQLRHKVSTHDYDDYAKWLRDFDIVRTKSTLFPRDFWKQHDYYMKLENEQKKEKIIAEFSKEEKKFKKGRLPELKKKYTFSDENYIIRPFSSVDEIINEGLVQNICVGGEYYLKEYLTGVDILLCLRRVSKPDVPYCTVEYGKYNNLIQARMKKNASAPKEVKEFLNKYNQALKQYDKEKEKAKNVRNRSKQRAASRSVA